MEFSCNRRRYGEMENFISVFWQLPKNLSCLPVAMYYSELVVETAQHYPTYSSEKESLKKVVVRKKFDIFTIAQYHSRSENNYLNIYSLLTTLT
jgi:hypothetical protein